MLSAILLAAPGFARAQQPASPEEVLEQLSHRIAAIYREMAVVSPTDSDAVRDLKRRFSELADNEEKVAAAAKAMAGYHAQLAAAQKPAPERHANYGDSAFRR